MWSTIQISLGLPKFMHLFNIYLESKSWLMVYPQGDYSLVREREKKELFQ